MHFASFFGRGEVFNTHSDDWTFVSTTYPYSNVSSPAIMIFKVIILISSVQKLLIHGNSILFLIICQAWNKFGCNAMHAQIFGKNFMAHCFSDTHFFSYLCNCQTMI